MVTKKLSQDFSRTESRILGALSKLDEFLMNPHVRKHSGTILRTFRNTGLENQEPNEDRSQNDAQPEVGSSVYRSPQSVNSDANETPYSGPNRQIFTHEKLAEEFSAKIPPYLTLRLYIINIVSFFPLKN